MTVVRHPRDLYMCEVCRKKMRPVHATPVEAPVDCEWCLGRLARWLVPAQVWIEVES
jgi:predicted nucleic acid-binding Zn ribbon protein